MKLKDLDKSEKKLWQFILNKYTSQELRSLKIVIDGILKDREEFF